jgi:hypothetical protein
MPVMNEPSAISRQLSASYQHQKGHWCKRQTDGWQLTAGGYFFRSRANSSSSLRS